MEIRWNLSGAEIEQEMAFAAGVPEMAINFIPHLAPMNRGINSTIVMDAMPGTTLEKIGEVYHQAYGSEQFVRILPPKRTIYDLSERCVSQTSPPGNHTSGSSVCQPSIIFCLNKPYS